jgi:hypothetical protein
MLYSGLVVTFSLVQAAATESAMPQQPPTEPVDHAAKAAEHGMWQLRSQLMQQKALDAKKRFHTLPPAGSMGDEEEAEEAGADVESDSHAGIKKLKKMIKKKHKKKANTVETEFNSGEAPSGMTSPMFPGMSIPAYMKPLVEKCEKCYVAQKNAEDEFKKAAEAHTHAEKAAAAVVPKTKNTEAAKTALAGKMAEFEAAKKANLEAIPKAAKIIDAVTIESDTQALVDAVKDLNMEGLFKALLASMKAIGGAKTAVTETETAEAKAKDAATEASSSAEDADKAAKRADASAKKACEAMADMQKNLAATTAMSMA